MRLCVYRTLWGVLGDCDGAKAGSPVLGVEEALQEIARWVEEEVVEEEVVEEGMLEEEVVEEVVEAL